MGIQRFTNNAVTTLAADISTTTQTAIAVASAALFPVIAGGSGDWFIVTLQAINGLGVVTAEEVVKVTATSGVDWVIARAAEGPSAAQTWVAGNTVAMLPTGGTQGNFIQTGSNLGTAETAAETAASAAPAAFATPPGQPILEGNFSRYGSGAAAGNDALLVSASGGSKARVPLGAFGYVSTLDATAGTAGGCSMEGAGLPSVLAPNGCDGLTISATGYAGSKVFRDFQLQQSGTFTNNGSVGNVGVGSKIVGYKFDNLTYNGFATAFFGQGFWNLKVVDPFFFDNYNGAHFTGLNVGVNWKDGLIQQGSATGSGTNYGFLCDVTSGQQIQSLNVDGTGVSQFAVSFCVSNGINVNVLNANFSFSTQYSIQLGALLGCTNVVNDWCNPEGGAGPVIAIFAEDLASATWDKMRIVGNSLAMQSGNSSSIGIYVGQNQMGRSVKDNAVGCDGQPFPIGISIAGRSCTCRDNSINSTITAILLNTGTALDADIGPNVIVPGAPQAAVMTNTSASIGVPNSALFPVGSYVQFDAAVNGFLTRCDYCVLTSAANVITVGPLGGTAVVATGATAVNVFAQLAPAQFTSSTPAGFRLNGRGTFWAQASGFSGAAPAGPVNWVATAGQVTLFYPAAFSGASNATGLGLVGLPRYLWPYVGGSSDAVVLIEDNGTPAFGLMYATSVGAVTFLRDAAGDTFTASGTKAILGGSATYNYG